MAKANANTVETADEETGEVFVTKRVPKITPASIKARPERCKLLEPPADVSCAIITGEATGLIEKEKDGQEFLGLIGKFEAVNLESGDTYISGVCYLPGGMHEMAVETLRKDPRAVVQFSFELIATPSTNPRGYSWIGKDVAKLEQVDPLAHIKARINPKLVSHYGKKLALPTGAERQKYLTDMSHADLSEKDIIDLEAIN